MNDATCPVLLLQGLDDPVVPPAQAESIAADLAAHGIPYAYIAFEGESHGFRKAENDRGQPGGRALLLRPDHGLHPAGRPAGAAVLAPGGTTPGIPRSWGNRSPETDLGRLLAGEFVARDSRTTVTRIWPG